MRYSISSKKQNVRACDNSFSQVFGVISVLKNCVNRPFLSALVQVILKPSSGNNVITVSPRLHFNRLGGREKLALFRQRHDARRLDDFAKFARTAVGNRRLVRVQFDDGIVNSKTRERGEDVFDRVDFYISFRQRRRAVRLRNIFHARLDFRLAFEVNAAEAHAAVGGRGQDGHVDPVAAVQADAGKTGGAIERLLIEHARLDKTRARLASEHQLSSDRVKCGFCF